MTGIALLNERMGRIPEGCQGLTYLSSRQRAELSGVQPVINLLYGMSITKGKKSQCWIFSLFANKLLDILSQI